MSNPEDRWRRAWIPGLVALLALSAGLFARCSNIEGPQAAPTTFHEGQVKPDSAYAAMTFDQGSLTLKGIVDSKTANSLRSAAKELVAANAITAVDDRLKVNPIGLEIADAAMIVTTIGRNVAPPAGLLVGVDGSTELYGTAIDAAAITTIGSSVEKALPGTITNSLTFTPPQPEPRNTPPTEPVPLDTAPPSVESTPVESTSVESTSTTATAVTSDAVIDTQTPVEVADSLAPVAAPADTAAASTAAPIDEPVASVPTLTSTGGLKGVQFVTGKADLTTESQTILDAAAKEILRDPTKSYLIGGHTDNVGEAAKNLALSQARSETVRAYLLSKGVDATKLVAKGFGDTQPVAPNDTAENRAKNRRIEFTLTTP